MEAAKTVIGRVIVQHHTADDEVYSEVCKALTLLEAEQDGWLPIAGAKKVPKGMMRVYSYKPTESRTPLSRHTSCDHPFGFRECDLYMDIPAPPATAGGENVAEV